MLLYVVTVELQSSLMKVKSNIHRHQVLGFSFACCHPPLSHRTDEFQMLVDSGSSKHFVDPKLIRGVKSRMLDYTKIDLPMEIQAAGHNILFGTAQGILLVLVRDT